jgi:hypothetical protein
MGLCREAGDSSFTFVLVLDIFALGLDSASSDFERRRFGALSFPEFFPESFPESFLESFILC